MGLVIKNSVSEKSDASLLRCYDKTKIFSADNPGGWQSSTTAFISDVTAATLTIYLTNTTTLLPLTTNPVVIDVFPTLPNVVNTPYEVTAAMLGYTDGVIPDGMITVEYNVTVLGAAGVSTTYTSSVSYICRANTCCCTKSLRANASACDCECGSEEIQTALYAWTTFMGIERSIECNKPQKAIEDLKSLMQLCANNNCLSCH